MTLPFDTSTLNPEQAEAVQWPGGPMLIFAGAGSGKTRVITCRIARLIAEGVHPSRILAVTFTNKAAREMRERVEGMVGPLGRNMWLGTFHSVCAKMLRFDGKNIGVDSNFIIYDDGEQLGLIREILKEKNIDEKDVQPRVVLSEISRAKEKLVSPKDYAKTATGFLERMVADIYPAYDYRLGKANAVDFDDIILLAVRLLQESEEAREKYQSRFLHVMVDEYQDVNFSQYKLATLLAEGHGNFTIVGDDDQSIYAWRGADVSLMLSFASDHPKAQVITLSQNYRSTKNILHAAHEVIRHNRSRADKRLWTDNDRGVPISISEMGTEQDEAMLLADTIIKDTGSGRRKLGDIAVLYRTNAQSRVLEEAFLAMRIPHYLIGGQRFYERKEIKDMVGYLRLTLNQNDIASFRRVINVPTRGIGATTLGTIDHMASLRGVSQWEILSDQEFQFNLAKKPLGGVRQFMALIEDGKEIAAQHEGEITPLLKHFMNRSGYLEELKRENTPESISRLENLQELLNVTTQYDFTEDRSLSGFLEQISLMTDVDSLEEGAEGVTLMTLHSSKGLEFPVVFVTGLEEGIFPHSRALRNDLEMDEERRLCYVGMTRAMEELHLVYTRRRMLYGQPSFNRRSRFLDDIPAEITTTLNPFASSHPPSDIRSVRQERTGAYAVTEPVPTLRAPTWEPPFKVGDKVRHGKFGIGIVIACSPVKNDAEVTVSFPGVVGMKKLLQSLAKLEAV